MLKHIIIYMKQILVELDDELARTLQKVAPAQSRQRSQFVRDAIRKALWEREEARTAAAYHAQPDSAEPAYVDPEVWEREQPPNPTAKATRKSRSR
jgi:predicted transcriptional regulator